MIEDKNRDKAVDNVQYLSSWQGLINSVESNPNTSEETKGELKEIKEKIKRVVEG